MKLLDVNLRCSTIDFITIFKKLSADAKWSYAVKLLSNSNCYCNKAELSNEESPRTINMHQ